MPDIHEILKARQKTHGDFKVHAKISQSLKRIVQDNLDHNLTDTQTEALTMILHKVARIVAGNPNEPDHWRDICGYSQLVVNDLNALKEAKSQNGH
jgi:Domain of unknown function (DUF6378)